MFQTKEQHKTSQKKHFKEREINNLPAKEFKVITMRTKTGERTGDHSENFKKREKT